MEYAQCCLALDNSVKRIGHLGRRVGKSFRRSFSCVVFLVRNWKDVESVFGLENGFLLLHRSSTFGEEGEVTMGGLEEKEGSGACHSCSELTSTGEEHGSNCFCSGDSAESCHRSWTERNFLVVTDVVGGEKRGHGDEEVVESGKPTVLDIDMMKERFAKLLLGEDMSGCGKGVPIALAISNAITNLCATLFGQLWRLEPLSPDKKKMWRREIEWLICVCDRIVEFVPSWQTFPDGSKLEVMTWRPRLDLYINLPALRKLDNMLLEILDSFVDMEFWYVDQGVLPSESDCSSALPTLQHQEEKWWLPVPCVPSGGLHEKTRKQLQHKRECTNQILKAVMAINSSVLTEMEVPDLFLESLPKTGKASLGDVIHHYLTADRFYPECLLDRLDLSSEHQALEIANRIEAAIFIWRKRAHMKPPNSAKQATSRTSWGMVKELMVDMGKRELLADRAENLLTCLRQRFPCLTQTTLDISKIQYNKDVGKSILESYSRVLESFAFSIISRIDDLLYVDDLAKHSDMHSSVPPVSVITHKRVTLPYSVPVSSTPCATAYTTPSLSPAPLISPMRGDRSPLINRRLHGRGFGVKKVLTDYLGVEVMGKNGNNTTDSLEVINHTKEETLTSHTCSKNAVGVKGIKSPPKCD